MTDSEAKPGDGSFGLGRDRRWLIAALVVFVLVFLALHYRVLLAGPFEYASSNSWADKTPNQGRLDLPEPESLHHTDHRFVVWLASRNAHALLTNPAGYFDAGICFPNEQALTFSEPAPTLGLLSIPTSLLTGDPVASFNLVFFLMTIVSALIMYWLVVEWTGIPGAGIVAALLYAFSIIKIGDVIHIYVYDNAWTLLALLFTRRLFEHPRWRDAVGLAAAIALQMGGSFYTLVAALPVALPFAVWLIVRDRGAGLRRIPPVMLGFVVLASLAVAWWVLGPYLSFDASGGYKDQVVQGYRRLNYLLPSRNGFWGWATILLGVGSLCVARWRLFADRMAGDPRWALLVSLVLAVTLSIGALTGEGNYVTDATTDHFIPWRVLAQWVPGLDVVRTPGAILPAAHMMLCVLAGFGAAALIRSAPARYAALVAALLIAVGVAETLRPSWLGYWEKTRYSTLRLAPNADELALHRDLAAMGDSGAILDAPVNPLHLQRASHEMLLAAYHRRPTSACYAYTRIPPELIAVSDALPEATALRTAYAMGFRTVVLHHAAGHARLRDMRKSFEASAREPEGARLERLAERPGVTAYRIHP